MRMGFPGGSVVKNPPAIQELQRTCVCSLGWEDSLEESMETHSDILGWRVLWTEEPGELVTVHRAAKPDLTEAT